MFSHYSWAIYWLSASITRPQRPKDEGKRPKEPPARSQLHLLDPIICGSIHIFNQLFIGEGEERGAGILDALEEEPEEDYEEE